MEELKKALEQLNIQYDDEMIKKHMDYMREIIAWNEKINLTAITNEDEFVTKHIIDSILCCNFPEYINAKSVIDVGTGAGFPGIPLAIISPEKEFLLADSLNKRIKIIDELATKQQIFNVQAIHGRAEELARNKAYRQKFDVCVSRAVANLSVLCEYCLPFICVGGSFLAYKGPDAETEAKGAARAIELLGGKLERIAPVNLEGYDHHITIIKKVRDTPAKYPRKAGTPAKEPI